MILLNILQNFTVHLLFFFTHYGNFSKWYSSILQGKLKFLMLHNLTKWFLKIIFTKLLLDKGSSTSYIPTKIAKIWPLFPLARNRTHMAWHIFMHMYFLYIHPPAPSNEFLFRFKISSLTIFRLFSFLLVSEVKFH